MLAVVLSLLVGLVMSDRVLVVNHTAGNVVSVNSTSGELQELVAAGVGGIALPDPIIIHDDIIYIGCGNTYATSAILMYQPDGSFVGRFDRGGPLLRPYGLAWSKDGELYVTSFLSDQLLVYSSNGDFKRVIATGDGRPGGLNGPNTCVFGDDGYLYIATEGSIAVDGQPTFPGLPSQILRCNVSTGELTVFLESVKPLNTSLGFSSLLGLAWGPKGMLYVSDYGGGVRAFDVRSGKQVIYIETSYTGPPTANALGGLAFSKDRLFVYVVAFIEAKDSGNPGALLRFNALTGEPAPAVGNNQAFVVPTTQKLARPLGLLVL